MALPSEPIVLPFKSEKASFALTYKDGPEEATSIELACVCFDRDGQILDSLQFNRLSAFDGALRHSKDAAVAAEEAVPGDEAIHMYPFRFSPECEVMLLVASAPLSPCRSSHLGTSGRLSFAVHAKERDAASAQLLEVDLIPFVTGSAAYGATALTTGHQSMIVCGVYTTPQGWTVNFDCSTYSDDSWGLLVPQLKETLKKWPFLSAASSAVVDPKETVVMTRPNEDHALQLLAASRAARLGEQEQQAPPAAAADGAPAVAATQGSKLRLELGWELWGKAEEAEDCNPEFTLTAYNLAGEEVVAVSGDNQEADGLAVADPEPEEDEEAEAEAEEAAAEEDEEGEEGEEKAPPPPPAPAVPEKKLPPFAVFPLKRKAYITLAELPKDAQSLVLTMANWGGSGFKFVRSLQARVLDVSAGEDAPTAAPLLQVCVDSAQGADETLTQVVMFKLYRELAGSAFSLWRAASVADVQALTDAEGGSEGMLQAALVAHKLLEKENEDARHALEEEGGDPDEAPDVRVERSEWRVRAIIATRGGESPDAITEELQNWLAFEGTIDASGRRTATAAKVQYPNKDSYFGGYSADAKAGLGLYAFANGALYLGEYSGGKRAGRGLMVMPDGGVYRGCFAADRFEGQGTYNYPDHTYYTGQWSAGKKHGQGTYWDAASGCLRGTWSKGLLKGKGQYDQPSYHFEGDFAKGIPAGPCAFTLTNAFRCEGLPAAAAAHILAKHGPTLTGEGAYSVPAGAEAETETAEGEEEPPADDPDKPGMPAFPAYEGLGFASSDTTPYSAPDIPFPPAIGAC